jgi:hypothetical protein
VQEKNNCVFYVVENFTFGHNILWRCESPHPRMTKSVVISFKTWHFICLMLSEVNYLNSVLKCSDKSITALL